MKYKLVLNYSVCVLFICCIGVSYGQEAVVPAGGDISGAGGSVSYSVGQIVYSEKTSASVSVVEGVQHAYEISVISTDEEEIETALVLTVYPNPTEDKLILFCELSNDKLLYYALYDIHGRLYQQNLITSNITEIPMQELPKAAYVLQIRSDDEQIKSFKILKKII